MYYMTNSFASEIIQKYEPIENGMFAFQSFIKYLYAKQLFMNCSYQIQTFG